MSDTSIIASDSLKYGSAYKRDNCWTRRGANICVFTLALLTILLSVALIVLIFTSYDLQNVRQTNGKKNGKNSGSTNSGIGFIDTFTNLWSSSSLIHQIGDNDATKDDEESYENDDNDDEGD
ncbi:unnamed protein product [Rotaria magnacalcarata]|uniref:Uncharacterized protein n=2 Tax=Rotaria magnacalcarata TaxID=392030 RepID=A0A814RKC4_9BILA|nr:unnamed protein product [Rotaria magnacalcarata]CAF5123475.1 unnamed protein product [Rotaria magnacalcarata]